MAEKKNAEVISSIEQETEERTQEVLDDDLLIEDDGDFFWVLQRVVWGILKGVFLLVAIIFLIWFIWGADDIFNTQKTTTESKSIPLKPSVETETPREINNTDLKLSTSEEKKISSVKRIGAMRIIETAYLLDKKQQVQYSGTLSESIIWLKKAKTLGEISPQILRIESPIKRAKKIEAVLLEADSILDEAVRLENILSVQNQSLFRSKKMLEKEIKSLDDQLFLGISRFDARDIDNILEEKIKKQQSLVAFAEQGKIRETLLKNINGFENLLKQKWIPLIRPVSIQSPKKNTF